MTAETHVKGDAVVVDYQDLVNGVDVSAQIEAAFGFHDHCLGLLLVKNLPKEYPELRKRLLHLASDFAALPESAKEKTVHAASNYSFGYSCGKEIMNGKPDVSKASYYANPVLDNPEVSKELQEQFPEYCHPNIWPTEDLPEFEEAFKALGGFIVEVGAKVAKVCDAFVHAKHNKVSPTHLQDVIQHSKTTKARLLHYFPQTSAVEDSEAVGQMDSWCGWHLDHGSLTGLTSAMFVDHSSNKDQEVVCPDPEAGLYIRNRGHQVVKVSIPRDCLAFQTGEALQLVTKGLLRATPHCVRGATAPAEDPLRYSHLTRSTMAVFMQPNLDMAMDDKGLDFGMFTKQVLISHYAQEEEP